tara:strand:+ start:39 stop:1337 length:1299 start_codon:yes stop_codon:yes gene_type:complete
MGASPIVALSVLVVVLGLGVWVFAGLLSVGISGLAFFTKVPIDRVLANAFWSTSTTPELLALPLFIYMAEILFRTRLSEMLLRGFTPWVAWLPGRLAHINVLACTIFAAVCGSSAATTATIGRITISELVGQGYDRRIIIGSLAGAGTLGLLIPPSLVMIIYGVLAEVSILKLFIAGFIPGFLLALAFMALIAVISIINPSVVPKSQETYSWDDRIKSIPLLLPAFLLIGSVLSSMYSGIASPTEAAVIGVIGAIAISGLTGTFSWENMKLASMRAVRTTSMIGLIVAGATFLGISIGYLGIPRFIASEITALNLGPYTLIAVLVVFYLILGCVLEGMSAIVMTLPITLPLIEAAGFDKLWFGVFLVITIEMAQVTPPVGFNLFVIQGLTRDRIGRIFVYTLPFLGVMIGMAFLVAVFPELVTYLPNQISFR